MTVLDINPTLRNIREMNARLSKLWDDWYDDNISDEDFEYWREILENDLDELKTKVSTITGVPFFKYSLDRQEKADNLRRNCAENLIHYGKILIYKDETVGDRFDPTQLETWVITRNGRTYEVRQFFGDYTIERRA